MSDYDVIVTSKAIRDQYEKLIEADRRYGPADLPSARFKQNIAFLRGRQWVTMDEVEASQRGPSPFVPPFIEVVQASIRLNDLNRRLQNFPGEQDGLRASLFAAEAKLQEWAASVNIAPAQVQQRKLMARVLITEEAMAAPANEGAFAKAMRDDLAGVINDISRSDVMFWSSQVLEGRGVMFAGVDFVGEDPGAGRTAPKEPFFATGDYRAYFD